MKIRCNHCGYEWNYKGSKKFYACCPNCLRKVHIENNKLITVFVDKDGIVN